MSKEVCSSFLCLKEYNSSKAKRSKAGDIGVLCPSCSSIMTIHRELECFKKYLIHQEVLCPICGLLGFKKL